MHTDPLTGGLTNEQAAARLDSDGPNELPRARRNGAARAAADLLREPMIVLLLGAGGIYFLLGELRDAVVLGISIFAVAGLSIAQNIRTEKSLERLRDLSSPRAGVIREGRPVRIPGREVVRGDLLLVAEGDRIAADGTVVWQSNLSVDEALLTGESVAIAKRATTPSSDGAPAPCERVFSGTLAVSGQARAIVTETGPDTEMGRIGTSLAEIAPEESPLQREMHRLVRLFGGAGIAVCALVAVVYAHSRGNLAEGLLAGLGAAMSVLPEEFPVVLMVFLALGALRISRQRVLTRRIPAIEALGAATVLCADKTGTLTENRMSLARLVTDHGSLEDPAAPLSAPRRELVEFAVLASQRTPFDPTEKAIRDFGVRTLAPTEHLHEDWELAREYPLSAGLLAVTHAWRVPGAAGFVIAAKGAPEAIADLCRLTADDARRLMGRVEALGASGFRVLAVARASHAGPELPERPHGFEFRLLGLLGLEDPLRPSVSPAIAECRSAGIRVLMVTGDYPATAARIAREIGLGREEPLRGSELEALDEETLRERLRTTSVVARVRPGEKLRLVRSLQQMGEVVVMTGDGVNDAPALKAAHVGIAMGGRGTDVAREAAALVLVDDDFSSIVAAIRLGRRIYDNLKKATAYLVAVHVPIAGMALLPVLFGWPLLLMPVQIVFLELIIDPASSIAFETEPEEEDVMRRPPRRVGAPLLSRAGILLSIARGAIVLAAALAVYAGGLLLGQPVGAARGAAFATLIVSNLGLILVHRSRTRTLARTFARPNPAMWWIVGLAGSFLLLVFAVGGLRGLFRFEGTRPEDAALGIAAGAGALVVLELVGRLGAWRRRVRDERAHRGGTAAASLTPI